MEPDQKDSERCSPEDDNDVHEPLFSRGTRQSEICAALPSKSLERACTIDRKSLRHRKSSKRSNRRSNVIVTGGVEDLLPVAGADEADGDEAEAWRRLEHVKALSSSLSVKRKTRDQLLSSPQYKLSGWSKWKHEQSKRWKRSKRQFNEFLDNFEIWRGSFKVIDGNFGSSVVAYFRFVKWLLLLNLLSTLLVLGAVVLPQAAMEPATFNDSLRMALNQSTETTSFQDDALNCSAQYENYIEAKNNLGATQKLIDFFQGTGWMEHTILFAGYYFNKTYFYEEEPRFFNMPLAYLLVPTVYLFLSLIFMVDHTSSGVKEKLVTQGDKFYRSCNKVFCGWDFSLCEEKAAALKHNSLYYEYFHDLADERRAAARRGQSTARRAVTAAVRAAVWLFVVCVWAGAIYLIFRVVADWTPELLRRDAVAASQWLTLVVEFLPSISMTALNAVFPPIFGIVAQFEGYEPASEVRVTIARTVMLRLLSIGVLVFTLTNQISNCDVGVTCGVCDTIRSHCWETHVGQEFYKLVILDFLVVVGITFFLEFPRKFIVRKFYDKNKLVRLVGYQEFIIPKEVLIIVYSQTICWLGGFFSPLIPAITVAKFLIFFYCKKLTLLHNCVPAARQYRASSSNYFFMLILMISFGLCLVFIFYCVGRIPPSQGCGPFRVYTQEPFYMYQVITNAIGNIPFFLQRFISIVWNWIAYFILLIILALTIYYYRAIASGNRRMIELLKDQLALEGKDKQFLLSRVNDALMRGDIHGESDSSESFA